MSSFSDILHNTPPAHIPIWFMRQAGRVLPSYLKLRQQYSFMQLMQTPQLACDVTLLPINELNVDAAILFSDILVIPQALGLDLDFTEKGPVFENPLYKFDNPISVLKPNPEKLNFVYQAIDLIKNQKPNNIPLIGFCGGPLTVLLYMFEGLGTKSDFKNAERFIINNKQTTKQIVEIITEITLYYTKQQLIHGVDCFRLFESNCGNIPFSLYKELFLPSVKKVCDLVRSYNRKFLYFPKSIGLGITEITPDICDYLSIDWQTDIYSARKIVDKEINLEGNFDPRLLFGTKKTIQDEIKKYKQFSEENPLWIFNLGHGILPNTPFENAKLLVEEVKKLR
ncbi:MAG: uroporphyrinogen decarboxylase [Bacteroidales bacterium]|nr:uroporphyrinogen decarboxylase [Bacteroidales bacterium]